jgi:uncharacterized protein (TIGR02145 family)
MKTIQLLLLLIIPFTTFSQVGIGTNVPESSAQLDVNSTNKGFLPPRMTVTERNAIVNPANGLLIFNTTSGCINYYIGTGWQEVCGTAITDFYPVNSVFCASGPTAVIDVVNPTTGKTWMDRNLGATQVATSATDAAAYGDLYQWGRRSDGHQCRTSATTSILSTVDQPVHGDFVLESGSPKDWRSPQNNNLWQGVNGINNPCPSAYRIPTESELNAERLSWASNTIAGAYASILKFSLAGSRSGSGTLSAVGSNGVFWSSTISTSQARYLLISSTPGISNNPRVNGYSVRCIKN